jgi:hypothetical protein
MSDSFAREIFVSSQMERPDMPATARFFRRSSPVKRLLPSAERLLTDVYRLQNSTRVRRKEKERE